MTEKKRNLRKACCYTLFAPLLVIAYCSFEVFKHELEVESSSISLRISIATLIVPATSIPIALRAGSGHLLQPQLAQ